MALKQIVLLLVLISHTKSEKSRFPIQAKPNPKPNPKLNPMPNPNPNPDPNWCECLSKTEVMDLKDVKDKCLSKAEIKDCFEKKWQMFPLPKKWSKISIVCVILQFIWQIVL